MRSCSADRSCICSDGAILEAEAVEYPRVRIVHIAILPLQVFKTRVERVSVFHKKFPAAHYAKAWAYLVAEFHLDLIEMQGQLTIALYFLANDIRNDLFMRRADDEIALVPILEAEQLRAVFLPAS